MKAKKQTNRDTETTQQGTFIQRKANGSVEKNGIPFISQARVGTVQTKLSIGQPGNQYEQEAEQIADQIMSTPEQGRISSAPVKIQCFITNSSRQTAEAPVSVERALESPGRPLEAELRDEMEGRFGYDFSEIKVHTGGVAEQSARDIGAEAYTVGQHLVFASNRYAPTTAHGRHLLAHELTHTIQQTSSQSTSRILVNEYLPESAGALKITKPIFRHPNPQLEKSSILQRQISSDRLEAAQIPPVFVSSPMVAQPLPGVRPPGYEMADQLEFDSADWSRMLTLLDERCTQNLSNIENFILAWGAAAPTLALNFSLQIDRPEWLSIVDFIVKTAIGIAFRVVFPVSWIVRLIAGVIWSAFVSEIETTDREAQRLSATRLNILGEALSSVAEGVTTRMYLECVAYREWLNSVERAADWGRLIHFRIPPQFPPSAAADVPQLLISTILAHFSESQTTVPPTLAAPYPFLEDLPLPQNPEFDRFPSQGAEVPATLVGAPGLHQDAFEYLWQRLPIQRLEEFRFGYILIRESLRRAGLIFISEEEALATYPEAYAFVMIENLNLLKIALDSSSSIDVPTEVYRRIMNLTPQASSGLQFRVTWAWGTLGDFYPDVGPPYSQRVPLGPRLNLIGAE